MVSFFILLKGCQDFVDEDCYSIDDNCKSLGRTERKDKWSGERKKEKRGHG